MRRVTTKTSKYLGRRYYGCPLFNRGPPQCTLPKDQRCTFFWAEDWEQLAESWAEMHEAAAGAEASEELQMTASPAAGNLDGAQISVVTFVPSASG